MKVTMLLCDYAQVAGDKLYVVGGGWSIMGPDPVQHAIAIKIDVDWNETDIPHRLVLFLEDADGRPFVLETKEDLQPFEVVNEFTVTRPSGVPEGTPIDVALAVNFGPLPLQPGSRYIWRLSIDGESKEDWVLSFTVRPRPED